MVIRDLHNFELCENGIIFGWFRLKTYFGEITTSDWIVIQHSDHSWFNGTEIKWGQIYLIFIDIGVKNNNSEFQHSAIMWITNNCLLITSKSYKCDSYTSIMPYLLI